jgi:polyhydroxybutyrate depolymerase
MRAKGMIVCFLLLLTACQPINATAIPSATPTTCPPGDYSEQLTSSNEEREYRLHIPASLQPEKPAALVLAFHGAGSTSEQFESYSGFSAVADREGFIVVYPQAQGEYRFWNTTAGADNRDIQFSRDLIEELESRCDIDPNRIYASGHSNGGGLANRLACDLSDQIAAIGSVSGAYRWSESCSPTRPVPVLGVHGTEDTVIPYNGYQDGSLPPMVYGMVDTPIPQWASAWGARNGCDHEPARLEQSAQVTKEQWNHCRESAEVILYTIHGGGHSWTYAIDAAQIIWDFFVQHPLVQ